MKKKILALAALVLIGGFSIFFFSACDKDTKCYVDVTVIDENTKLPMSGVFVKIDIDSSYIKAEGTTDAAGHFKAEFMAPAIFNVMAKYETGYDSIHPRELYYSYRKGNNTIRLKEGDTVESTVVLEAAIIRELR